MRAIPTNLLEIRILDDSKKQNHFPKCKFACQIQTQIIELLMVAVEDVDHREPSLASNQILL